MSSAPRLPLSLRIPAFLFVASTPIWSAETAPSPEAQAAEIRQLTDYILDQAVQTGWRSIGLWLLVSTVVLLGVTWLIAKLLAGGRGTFKNAIIYTIQMWIVTILLFVAAYFCIQSGSLGVLFCLGLGFLIATIGFACKTFEISILRGIVFIIGLALVNPAAEYISEAIVGPIPWLAERSPQEEEAAFAKWKTERLERELKGSASAPQAAATLPELYANLQKSRAELNVNDPAAVARFNEQVAAYNAAKAAATPPVRANPKISEPEKSAAPTKKKTE